MSVLNENTIIGASAAGGDYEIEQSLRFNDDDTSYLTRTPSAASNRKTWTWSGWVKRGGLGGTRMPLFDAYQSSSGTMTQMMFTNTDILQFYTSIGGIDYSYETLAVFRDPSAWYHIVVVLNTVSSTQQDRFIVYVNGERQANANQYGALDLDVVTYINSTEPHNIGKASDQSYFADGYMAEVNFIDGQALTPDSFGETGTYGEWKPIAYDGTYGTNGFYLKFENASSLGNDSAGSNNWTPNNLAATDQMVDSPTNNFATLNPLDAGGTNTVAEGNLQYDKTGANFGPMRGTLGVTTGKWYFEAMRSSNTNICQVGVSNNYDISQSGGDNSVGSAGGIGAAWDSRGYYYRTGGSDGGKNTFATNEIVSIAFDADTGKIWWRKSGGSWQDSGNPETGANPSFTASGYSELMPFVNGEGGGGLVANFGADSSFAGNKTPQGNQDANGIGDFFYPVPNSYLALCTANLPSVDVIPSENFNPVIYSGNSSTQSIAVGFQPDFTWIKNRGYIHNHKLLDSVRGATKELVSNTTDAEITGANGLTSFDSNGFTLGSAGGVNSSSYNYVAWNWKAGGSASSNTNGSITSQVSANPSAGFSIVSYTGNNTDDATVGHGLSRYPDIVIFKNRENTGGNWLVMTSMLSPIDYLNGTAAFTTSRSYFSPSENSTWTTSIKLDAHVACNSADDFIAYCFHSVDGHSKVGTYGGNGSTDGPFVYCGFKPAFLILRNIGGGGEWIMQDDARQTFNADAAYNLAANRSVEENNGTYLGGPTNANNVDWLSNGFKIRADNGNCNAVGGTFLFIAFAESPFKHTNAH